jgi:glycosyltransferase involved in cell wall biosynthesis
VSHEIKEKIVKAGLNPHAVTVIPNMIDIDNLAKTEIDLPKLQQNSFKIVTVSRLDSMKTDVAQSLILCAERLVQEYPHMIIQVVIIGDGTEFDKIRKMADEVNQKLGFQSIILTGYRKDAIRIISMGDIVVGAGRVVLEAMAIGKPIIVATSKIHGILTKATLPQIAKYNFSGRNSSEQTNSENTFQFISKLIQDKPFRESAAEFSHEIIKKSYSTRAVVNRIQEVYKQLLC